MSDLTNDASRMTGLEPTPERAAYLERLAEVAAEAGGPIYAGQVILDPAAQWPLTIDGVPFPWYIGVDPSVEIEGDVALTISVLCQAAELRNTWMAAGRSADESKASLQRRYLALERRAAADREQLERIRDEVDRLDDLDHAAATSQPPRFSTTADTVIHRLNFYRHWSVFVGSPEETR